MARKPVIIHIHRQRIERNRKSCTVEPPVIVRRGRKREYGCEVAIGEGTRIVYSPHKPLDCGARLWIETTDAVRVLS
jgi:hypothetical protein